MNLRDLCLLSIAVLPTLASGCVIELDGDLRDHIGRGCFGQASGTHERIVVDEPFSTVVVDGGVGDIRIHTQRDAGAVVNADLYGDDGGPKARVHVSGGVLHVEVECGSLDCCGADLDIAVPAEVDVEVGLGVGDLDVLGIAGLVTLDVGVGDIGLEHVSGGLDVHAGTGDIDGRGLRSADAWIEAGTGDVSLEWAADADPNAIAVELGVGAVELAVPHGSYDLRLEAGVGDIDVDDLRDEGGASKRISVEVGTGDIEISGR